MAVRDGGGMNILEIEAEGLPRYVGPFSFRFQAEDWAKAHVRNGSWSVITTTRPQQAEDEIAGQPFVAKTFRENPQTGVSIAQNFGTNPLEAELNRGLAADKAEQ